MATVTFDTHKFVKRLEAAGVTPDLAEAFVEAQQESIAEILGSTIATKKDIEIALAPVRTDNAVLKWMVSFNIALTVTILWKIFG